MIVSFSHLVGLKCVCFGLLKKLVYMTNSFEIGQEFQYQLAVLSVLHEGWFLQNGIPGLSENQVPLTYYKLVI